MSDFSTNDRTTEAFVREESAEADKGMVVEVHDDRTRENTTTSMSRMRTDWGEEDKFAVEGLHEVIENRMLVLFGDAYRIMNDLYDIVRAAETDDEGTVLVDGHGFPLWMRNASGGFVEDYSRLTSHDLRHLLFQITTRLFDWEQKRDALWGDSMFAKAQWEQALAASYEGAREAGVRTVEDRTQAARRVSREERLFAIFLAVLSRRADSLTRSMERLGQRLKDVVTA